MKVQMVMLMMPNRAPHPDARGAAHFIHRSRAPVGANVRWPTVGPSH